MYCNKNTCCWWLEWTGSTIKRCARADKLFGPTAYSLHQLVDFFFFFIISSLLLLLLFVVVSNTEWGGKGATLIQLAALLVSIAVVSLRCIFLFAQIILFAFYRMLCEQNERTHYTNSIFFYLSLFIFFLLFLPITNHTNPPCVRFFFVWCPQV